MPIDYESLKPACILLLEKKIDVILLGPQQPISRSNVVYVAYTLPDWLDAVHFQEEAIIAGDEMIKAILRPYRDNGVKIVLLSFLHTNRL